MPSSDMDAERPKSREDVLTENTDDFIIGDRIWVNGTKPGYIQYLGDTRFAPGEWAGVVLDDHSGKNDGTVAGVHYFQCEPKRGVFARLHKLTRYPLVHANTSTPLRLGEKTPTPPPIQRCLTPTRTPSPGARNLREGDRVSVASSSGPPKTGVLKYLGLTDFAAGDWAGVELDEPLGKNDGTVAGKRYFRCPPNYGLFSPVHKVTRMTGSLDRHRRTLHVETEKENPVNLNQHPSKQNIQDEQKKYASESETRAQRLRQLLEAAEAERRDLAAKLEEERRKVEELEFRIEEECISKDDLESERKSEREKVEELERRLEKESRKNEMVARGSSPDSVLKEEMKRQNEETKSLREKLRQADVRIHELQTAKPPPTTRSFNKADELTKKEEALLQTQLSLDNKKREVQNLLSRIAEQERELEKGKNRQSKQMDIIDDLNVKLKKVESKCSNLAEEMHSATEKTEEYIRRLQASVEQVNHLEAEKKRLEEQLLSPESTSQEQALLARLQEREREISEWRREAEAARSEADRLREERERSRKELEERLQTLNEEHREECKLLKRKYSELEDVSSKKVRDMENQLSKVRGELESTRVEGDARLSRQEARLQEVELRTEGVDRLREQISRLQAEKDVMRVEKEETVKRLQISEQSKSRWELEANRASAEVNLLKSQVQHLRTEFTSHREDLVKKLAETKFDAEVVQDLHFQIEEHRRLVEEMQLRLKYSEGERENLETSLTTARQNQTQVENGLKQEMESLRRRFSESEAEKQSAKRSLEAAQLLIDENKASQRQLQAQNVEKSDKEKGTLEKRIVDLQRELASGKNGKLEPDSSVEELKREKEALEQQVNFMNSVIVDMQHKNDDLRSKLDILETEVIFDGHLHLSMPHNHSTSHLFCDICNIFDVHDTEDCPKQWNNSIRRTLSYSSQESEF